MIVTRTETIYLKQNKLLSYECHLSKNLFNEANYLIKQRMRVEKKWLRYKELDYILKNASINYHRLPSPIAQQTLRLIDKSWKAFFKSIKEWKKEPKKFLGRPKPPKYKAKNGEHIIYFTNQQCHIRDGYVTFPKLFDMKLKTTLTDVKLIQVRILPMGVGYRCEIVYEKDVDIKELDNKNIASIDLGLSNLVTMVNNIGKVPIIIKGNIPKSINQYYNKKLAKLKSDYKKHGLYSTKRIQRLHHKRNLKINDFFHKTSRYIIDYCVKNNIGTLIVGHNEGWKQNIKIGVKNNQKFVQLPFNKLIMQLEYKCEENGINFITTEESYTSKCSFLDNESMEKHDVYCGNRFKRGLFKTANGTIINADVNGAYNIMRKVISEFEGIEDVALHPVCISHEHICY